MARVVRTEPRPEPAPRTGIPLWPGVVVALVCGAVYLAVGSNGTFRFFPSTYIHHTLTANAWLHGRLDVPEDEIAGQFLLNRERRRGTVLPAGLGPSEIVETYRARLTAAGRTVPADLSKERSLVDAFHDWVHFGGRYYAYWPPLPAAALVPLVWAGGPGVSDVFVANLLGLATVFFVYLMVRALRPQWPALNGSTCAALALAYGLGTCHMYQACLGQVWYLTQLSSEVFLIIAICCGLNALRDPRWMAMAGVALGIAFLGRNTAVLAAPFFALVLWLGVRGSSDSVRRYALWGGVFGVAIVAAIAVQLAFNHARFGDAWDFGQGHLADEGGNPRFNADFKQYGRFNLHYFPHNVWYYFLNPWMGPLGGRRAPYDGRPSFDPEGNSLFLVSPFMAYLFASWRRRDLLLAAVLAGAIPGTIALMLFHGTGWFQFGQRYLLDTMPFLLILVVFGMRGRLTPAGVVLIVLSVIVNAWGTYRFHVEQP